MNMLENQGAQKRRRPSVKVLMLAAALAVGCVLSIAAGLPNQVYNFMTGGTLTVTPAGDGVIGGAEMIMNGGGENAPVVLENGKLWFKNGEERIDITDLIDENTPYIHEHTDPATGNKGYVIVGGTPEDFGWAEIATLDGASATGGENFALPGSISLDDLQDIQLAEDGSYVVGGEFEVVDYPGYRPWLQAALDQLGLNS